MAKYIDREIPPEDKDIQEVMNSYGIYNRRSSDTDWFRKFSRVQMIDPTNSNTLTREYLFFTKPNLHIMNTNSKDTAAPNLVNSAFFTDAIRRFPRVVGQLQTTRVDFDNTVNNPFCTILSNSVTSGLELPDLEADERETASNIYGTKISYRGSSYTSDQEFSFSLEFKDTKFFEVYMFFKIYDEYERFKHFGLLEVTEDTDSDQWKLYVLNKIIHDQFSIYKFVVGEDGMTITFAAKVTGVYPTGAPRSSFSDMNKEGEMTFSVPFKGQFIKDNDPTIFEEFNRIGVGSNSSFMNARDLPLVRNGHFDGRMSSMPFVHYNTIRSGNEIERMATYQLLWKE